ncbi:hypothetical protein BVRB_5g100600 [Beta vulgaris subsp. vulgaris]|nr:hypothetical protein BVRB_5g100600 [Beta vulgaris subsp. vulgaris]
MITVKDMIHGMHFSSNIIKNYCYSMTTSEQKSEKVRSRR